MKKLIASLLASMMVFGTTASLAEGVTLYPEYDVSMETYGDTDITTSVSIDPSREMEEGYLVYGVYATDLYHGEQVEALQPGDKVFVNNEELTVETVGKVESGVEINGGFFESDGASLYYADGEGDWMYSAMYDDVHGQTLVGEASAPLADTVTVKLFRMGPDGEYTGEYDEAAVAKADVQSYLADAVARGFDFSPSNTSLTLENGQVPLIVLDWAPNV